MLEASSYLGDFGERVDVKDGNGIALSTRIISIRRIDEGRRCLSEKQLSGGERGAGRRIGWHDGNIVLIGDAAHCMSPEVGQGGAQSIEDAKVLVDCLIKHEGNLEESFTDYTAIRKPHVTAVSDKALRNGRILSIENPIVVWLRSAIVPYIGVSLLKQQTFIWAHKA